MILVGTKTETRRLWKRQRAKVGSVHLAKLKMLSKEYFARLQINYVFQQRLGDITDEQVRKEGYSTRDEYFKKLCEINKMPYHPRVLDMVVWVVGFELVK
jgi:hypothetical protein